MFTEKDRFNLYERLATTPLEREMLKDFNFLWSTIQTIKCVAIHDCATTEPLDIWLKNRIQEIEEHFE